MTRDPEAKTLDKDKRTLRASRILDEEWGFWKVAANGSRDTMGTMSDLIVRRAEVDDVPVLAVLIDAFAKGHPAERHVRSTERLRDVFFGNQAMAHGLLAEKNGTAVGFGAWRKAYDFFWSMYGGEALGLYVAPSHRGLGVAACIVAAMCAEIRRDGGHFLQTSYDADLAHLYERVGVGRSERACHVSALAFERLAAAAGRSAREVARALPDKSLNYVPVDSASR
ncbi:MAG TPA: GNAT family N-acetyltransferase [Bryobacteraceae bacterium]|jgi:GNAT superfamily N-acetyltransferase|nr:GNAT family N-acetyltransferase [Bryobacteraceae bacterium]